MRKRSPGYLLTLDPNSEADEEVLREVRGAVRRVNRAVAAAGVAARYRVSLSPRMGRNNEFAWKYANRFHPRLRVEDAQAIDVYLSVK